MHRESKSGSLFQVDRPVNPETGEVPDLDPKSSYEKSGNRS